MQWFLNHIHSILTMVPEIPFFVCLALGYAVGKISFGKFQLGGVAGSLLVAVIISQFGVTVDAGLKNFLFALFIYAVGYESGPQFFRSLNRESIREILLAACLALTGLATVVVLAKIFHLDKGLAAGVAAGGLTQSAILGTASDALAKLGLSAAEVTQLQHNVAIGYAVTYVFGSFGAIILCVNVLQWFMGKSIRDDALQAEISLHANQDILQPGEELAVRRIVGRVFKLNAGVHTTVETIEAGSAEFPVTVERVRRGGTNLDLAPDLKLQGGDLALLVGSGPAVRQAADPIGAEVYNVSGMDVRMKRPAVELTADQAVGQTAANLKKALGEKATHGIYFLGVSRAGEKLETGPGTVLRRGDVLTLFGSEKDLGRAAGGLGHVIIASPKTDFIYMGAGLVVGLLIGMITVRLAGLPLTLGSGGGALLSGLVFGWLRTRNPRVGNMPNGAVQILKDLGLAGFVIVVGLSTGLEAVSTIKEKGLTLFFIGALVTIIPLLLTMVIGRYLIGYKNSAVLAGALTGSRSANPAFGEVLNKAGNSVPTVPFAITYALANVFLTLLGPLVVSLV